LCVAHDTLNICELIYPVHFLQPSKERSYSLQAYGHINFIAHVGFFTLSRGTLLPRSIRQFALISADAVFVLKFLKAHHKIC
jgi:hypothetical protein